MMSPLFKTRFFSLERRWDLPGAKGLLASRALAFTSDAPLGYAKERCRSAALLASILARRFGLASPCLACSAAQYAVSVLTTRGSSGLLPDLKPKGTPSASHSRLLCLLSQACGGASQPQRQL